MTGINNIAMEEYTVAGTYGEILKWLTSCYRDAKVVVQSILPVRLPWVDREKIREINRYLEEMSEQFGAAYLDLYGLFTDSGGTPVPDCLLEDGVHLSARGYERWSEAVERFLVEAGTD